MNFTEKSKKSSKELISEFIKFAVPFIENHKNCKFKQLPRLVLTKDDKITETLGHNEIGNNRIVVYVNERNVADICRTIGHELIHSAQDVLGELKENSGETGSDQENEANALAGVLLRHFGKMQPDIYRTAYA